MKFMRLPAAYKCLTCDLVGTDEHLKDILTGLFKGAQSASAHAH